MATNNNINDWQQVGKKHKQDRMVSSHNSHDWKTVASQPNTPIYKPITPQFATANSERRCGLLSQSRKITIKCEPNNNDKKVLCMNVLKHITCKYEFKCKYAHSLDDQNVDPVRKRAYEIIIYHKGLDAIDLRDDEQLYKTLLILTNRCDDCIVHKCCVGGYNCKNGVCKDEYRICRYDLVNKFCSDPECKNIHLTKYGMKPYNTRHGIFIPRPQLLNNEYITKIEKSKHDILQLSATMTQSVSEQLSDTSSDNSLDNANDFINNTNTGVDSCELSIFE